MSEDKSVSEVQPSAQDRVKEITDKLEAGLKALFEGDNFKQYLDTMSKFHNYSFNNTMLIALQKPEATLVAGFNSWKNNFERSVNKGEKGIKIFAPAPYKKKKLQEKIDTETELPVLDKDGKPVMEEVTVTIPAFKVVSVFDVSQTNGKELPTLGVDELKGDVENFEKFFGVLKEVSPVPIKFDEIDGSAKGFYHQVNKDITIKQDMPEVQTIKTAIHEIAHAKLHDHDLKKADIDSPKKDRKTEEVEAESVAYTVCQHFGIDTSDYSFAYVASWGSGKDTPELKASLETIRSTASELITQIEDKLRRLEREKVAEQETSIENAPAAKSAQNNIIGNTPYKNISDKAYLRVSVSNLEKIEKMLADSDIAYSGRISGKSATLTVNQKDYNLLCDFETAAKAMNGPENVTANEIKQENKWRFYIIPDLKSLSFNGTLPRTPIEYFDTFDTAKSRFDELRNQPYNSEKGVLNSVGLPVARLTLGIDSNNAVFDIIQVRDNKNVLVDDFTRNSSFSEDKDGIALLNHIADKIGFDTVMLYTEQENGGYNDMPEMIPFKDWKNPYFDEKPKKEQLNIIGNTEYKNIPDKFFIRMSAEKAQEIAAVLEKNGLPFSGRIDGDKATITINKADKETYKRLIMPPEEKLKEYKNEVEKAVSDLDNAENAVEIANEKLSLVEQEICEVMDENGDIPDPELKAALMDKLRNAMEFAQNLESHFEDKQINFNMALNNFSGFYVKMKEQEYEDKMPDKTVTLTQMVEYGYSYNPKNEMLPLDTEKAAQLFDLGAEVYRLYEDDTEGLVDNKAEIGEHRGLFGIEKAEWEKVQPFVEHMDKILAEQPKREEFLLHGNVPAAGIYQLKENNDTRNLTYLNSKYLEEKGLVPDRENYNLVYSFEVVADDFNNKNAFLNKVYEKFNNDHPEDYLGRSLCVSDVVVMHNGEDLSAHYVDSFGFKELDNFGAVHKEMAQQEKSTAVKEQPKQTAEKAAKPKAKSKTKAEKKPSVLDAIEEIKKNSPKQSSEKVNEKGVEI